MKAFLTLVLIMGNYSIVREGDGTPPQYSCLENSMDGGAWWATVHGVTKSRKQLSDFTSSLHFTVVIMSYQGDRDLRGKFQ